MQNILKMMLAAPQTVFSFKELLLMAESSDERALRSQLSYYVKTGDLQRVRRGLYTKAVQYDTFELATKIFTPSYISFETVLSAAGIIFQWYSPIFVATYQSREIVCDGQTYHFHRVRPTVLTNPAGIDIRAQYSIATPERAFLDTVYLNTRYHFDNLDPLNWDRVYEILAVYGEHKKMAKRVEQYRRSHA